MNSRKIVIGALLCLIVSLRDGATRKHTLLSRAPAMQASRRIHWHRIQKRARLAPDHSARVLQHGGPISPEELNVLDVFVPRV